VCGSTRTRGYGSGRVDVSRVGSGTTSTGTGIPGFTRQEHDFDARTFYFCMFSKLLMMKQLWKGALGEAVVW